MSTAAVRPSALIDFRAPAPGLPAQRLAFDAPARVLRAATPDEVPGVLADVAAEAAAGRWCVGWVAYEAAPAFDRAFVVHAPPPGSALARFLVFEAPLAGAAAEAAWAVDEGAAASVAWTGGPRRARFDDDIAAIHAAIRDGVLYQVNHTAPLSGLLQGPPLALFAALRAAQPLAYAAWIDGQGQDADVLSVSPELFFDWRDGRLLARPMKGTAPRGADAAEDAAQAAGLVASDKERAENLMIVDLLRNDLSRVAEPFSVRVPRLFHTEAWPTVWQMSSDVSAQTRAGVALPDIFGALFPCGSVTGAPKASAMQMIRRLEPAPRGVYCGAVGLVQPGGTATFNVPIRTVVHDAGAVRCGIGSGITADAQAPAEWDEWRHKRAFVDRASQAFDLLETLRLQDGAWPHGPAHLARLAAAAGHFGFHHDAAVAQAVQAVLAAVAQAHPEGAWRVRLLATRAGEVRAEAFVLAGTPQPVRLQLADRPLTGADSEFVRFKTTRRAHYDAFTPADAAVFDTLLWNERGELTECTRGNVALRLDGRWLTPARACGLLPGIGRAHWLAAGRIEEAVLRREDLARAEGLAFFNGLRGWLDAVLA